MSRRWFVIAVAALGCHNEPEVSAPRHAPAESQLRPEQLARGQYVATISGCTVCHARGGGEMHAPNITPDREAGIGKWSDAQIIKAVREGVRPDGRRLSAMMPYPFYHVMTDDDAKALAGFMRTLTPDHTVVQRGTFPMPPVELQTATGNVDRVEDLGAHGKYVASLMHCAMCHGPDLSGQKMGDMMAPNITPDRDTGVGTWSDQDLISAVRMMKMPSGDDIGQPMSFYKDSFAKLADDDAHALVQFVHSVPAVHKDTQTEHGHMVSLQP